MIRLGVVGHLGYEDLPSVLHTISELGPGLGLELHYERELHEVSGPRRATRRSAAARRAAHARRRRNAAARRSRDLAASRSDSRRESRPSGISHVLQRGSVAERADALRSRRLHRRIADGVGGSGARHARRRAHAVDRAERRRVAQGRVRARRRVAGRRERRGRSRPMRRTASSCRRRPAPPRTACRPAGPWSFRRWRPSSSRPCRRTRSPSAPSSCPRRPK